MTTGDKISKLREHLNLSLQQLSDKLDIAKSAIWNYENNKTLPSAEILKRISIFFNVTVDYLLFDESEKEDIIKISDKNLIQQFIKISKLDPEIKTTIMNTIDLMLKK